MMMDFFCLTPRMPNRDDGQCQCLNNRPTDHPNPYALQNHIDIKVDSFTDSTRYQDQNLIMPVVTAL